MTRMAVIGLLLVMACHPSAPRPREEIRVREEPLPPFVTPTPSSRNWPVEPPLASGPPGLGRDEASTLEQWERTVLDRVDPPFLMTLRQEALERLRFLGGDAETLARRKSFEEAKLALIEKRLPTLRRETR